MVELLKGVNARKQMLIDKLIVSGLNQSNDKRSFQELTLTELEREWQMFNENGVLVTD